MKPKKLTPKQLQQLINSIANTPLPIFLLSKASLPNLPIPLVQKATATFKFTKEFLTFLYNCEQLIRNNIANGNSQNLSQNHLRKETILLSLNSFCNSFFYLSETISAKLFKRLIKKIQSIIKKAEQLEDYQSVSKNNTMQ